MRIPHQDKLKSQSFSNSNVEFVWLFKNKQIIFGVELNRFYVKVSEINENGDENSIYTIQESYKKSQDALLLILQVWNKIPDYNFFSNGQNLVPLIEDSLEFLS